MSGSRDGRESRGGTRGAGPARNPGARGRAHVALGRIAAAGGVDPATMESRAASVRERMFRGSTNVVGEHIERISAADVEALFDLLDDAHFAGRCRACVVERGAELHFRLARRMTRTAGVCRFWVEGGRDRFEIAISAHVLFENFRGDIAREVIVNGLPCRSRFDCLTRVLEHEMAHLIEFLLWGESDCAAPRFFGIVHRHFGHTATRHAMVTRRERAERVMNLRPGSAVEFDVGGRALVGFINRITTRATVLVESPSGRRYSDGKRYAKYYVPLGMLRARGAG